MLGSLISSLNLKNFITLLNDSKIIKLNNILSSNVKELYVGVIKLLVKRN